ncbi:MAG: hypothetical protein R3330_16835, partial [Saprospiraceae bacterium]|nr:hypothetical protein [Saprospiraceae bacterium]
MERVFDKEVQVLGQLHERDTDHHLSAELCQAGADAAAGIPKIVNLRMPVLRPSAVPDTPINATNMAVALPLEPV